MTTTEVDLADPFPSLEHRFYGRSATWLGEDGHAMVAGHDRRSYAALNALRRDDDGIKSLYGQGDRILKRWVTFTEECGCTEAEHARHEADPPEDMTEAEWEAAGYHECDCDDGWGLPPCRDEYGWMANLTDKPFPGSVPVLSWTKPDDATAFATLRSLLRPAVLPVVTAETGGLL